MDPKTMGDNSTKAIEDRPVLLLHHVGQIEDVLDQLQPLQAELKKRRRLAKAAGFELGDEIDFALKLRRSENPDKLAKGIARRLGVAQALNVPVGFQLDMFAKGGPAERQADAVEAAFEFGITEGLLGRARATNRYQPNAPEYQQFLRGYDAGQKRLREALERDMEAKNAAAAEEAAGGTSAAASNGGEAPKRRGRPKGAKNKAKAQVADNGVKAGGDPFDDDTATTQH